MKTIGLSKDRIIGCAQDIVRSEGEEALGLRRIARELGVTAPALYGYVDSMDDLLRSLAEAQFAELTQRFATLDATHPVDRVRGLSRLYIEYALEEPRLFRLLFRFPPEVAGTSVDYELPMATQVFQAAATPIQEGHDTGTFPNIEPLGASLAVWAAVHGCATVLSMGFEFDHATAQQLIDDVLTMVIAGLEA